jgi:3-hydroxy-3-methylglutaryl CoA synthase
MHDVGIENLSVYLPMYSLSLDELARARGVDPQKYRLG